MLTLGAWYVTLMGTLFALTCLFMLLVILIQKPRGGGLSGAFGGAGGGSAQAAFGAKTGDVLTWFTVFCFVTFLLLAMGLTWSINPPAQQAVPVTGVEEEPAVPSEPAESPPRDESGDLVPAAPPDESTPAPQPPGNE